MRLGPIAVICLLAFGLGAALAWRMGQREPSLPEGPALVARVRQVARLETLDVSLYRKIDFSPDPQPAGSVWGDLAQWTRYALHRPRGRAIVFAEAHLGIDLAAIDEAHLRVQGDRVQVVLPPVQTQVELRPAETEVLGSNLDTAETAQLLEHARTAFQRAVAQDLGLNAKARGSAQQALRSLLLGVGFREVQFVASLPGATPRG